MQTTHYGPLTFIQHENGLQILPNREYQGGTDISDVEELYLCGSDFDKDEIMWCLLEYALCNGWDRFTAEEIGGMSSCELILSPDIWRDDNHEVDGFKVGGMVYWHERYAIELALDSLMTPEGLWLMGVML